jgi:hypothetical protein
MRQVCPPSSETSTPATTPPPSTAVPEMVTVVRAGMLAPEAGCTIEAVGAVTSVDLVAATSPGCMLYGWAPMSANRLTVACCIRASTGVPLPS